MNKGCKIESHTSISQSIIVSENNIDKFSCHKNVTVNNVNVNNIFSFGTLVIYLTFKC